MLAKATLRTVCGAMGTDKRSHSYDVRREERCPAPVDEGPQLQTEQRRPSRRLVLP